jgi:hypothetical protein
VLRQWVEDAEATNDDEAGGAELKIAIARSSHVPASFRWHGIGARAFQVSAPTSSGTDDVRDVLLAKNRSEPLAE